MNFDRLLKEIFTTNNPYLMTPESLARLVYDECQKEVQTAYNEGKQEVINSIKVHLDVINL